MRLDQRAARVRLQRLAVRLRATNAATTNNATTNAASIHSLPHGVTVLRLLLRWPFTASYDSLSHALSNTSNHGSFSHLPHRVLSRTAWYDEGEV